MSVVAKMSDEASTAGRLKRRQRAASLGMFMPPVGYAYAGRFGRGAAAFVGAAAFIWLLSNLPFGLLDYRPVAVVAAVSHFLVCIAFACDLDRVVRQGEDRTGLWYQEGIFYCLVFAAWIALATSAHTINATWLFKVAQVCRYSWPMEPALRPKECVLVAPNRAWERGDIVFFLSQPNPPVPSFGRVIGLPGDVVAIHQGNPVVNGRRLDQSSAPLPSQGALSRFLTASTKAFDEKNGDRNYLIVREPPNPARYEEVAERRVADGHLYLLGDARDKAMDSRVFGDIPVESALGKPVMVTWSPDWSRLGKPVR